MRFYSEGQWQDRPQRVEVIDPASGEVIDTVPQASREDVERAIAAAVDGATPMRQLTAFERFEILARAVDLLHQRREDMARTISQEEGKTLAEARAEVHRSIQTLQLSAEEAKRIFGEVVPLDAGAGVRQKFGFTLRVPCGVVVAITPFNFPLNLVCHKVGPGLAAGNSVILKPASDTPLSALRLVEILLEAGLPPLAITCLTGRGSEIGEALCTDRRVRKISFTGSREVGERICRMAGLKRVTMELGSNSPLIILPDADVDKVVEATVICGYANAGQVCISAQRIIATPEIEAEYLQKLIPRVEQLRVGNPLDERTEMGPMVRQADAERVEQWLREAAAGGARLACGGTRDGAFLHPAVLTNVRTDMRVWREELFGPAVAVMRADSVEQAIELANDTAYGLSAGVFTQDIDRVIQLAQRIEAGNIHINWGPMWRTDLMPYGGLKESGLGREGPRYAMEEMTEVKTVVIHLGQ
ncbi:MAG: aldehyde dehydrogenase [Pirellulaceae bacterium]|nr:MAG: aldehyde dehydrogenase [Pirellulaceae bacterium]